jgi:hypothetical protein
VSGLSDLVTCIVSRDRDTWEVIWTSDGRTPSDFAVGRLTDAVERAINDVAVLYADQPAAATSAELQFAIYPWADGGEMILDIQGTRGDLVARDIQGSDVTLHGRSLEDLLANAETSLPDASKVMFRWIRPVLGLS